MEKKLSFEQQMNELETIVNELSHSQDLEESLKMFERGLVLSQQATERLNKIENKLIEIKKKFSADAPVAFEALDEE